MLLDVIKNFPKQFKYNPKIDGGAISEGKKHIIVAGMGGSHLAADLIKVWKPHLLLTVHRDYGLPDIEHPDDALFIASSYSGNTEETLDAFCEARKQKISSIAIATGGELLKEAKASNTPFIELPKTGIQPRHALGYSFKAFLCAMGEREGLREATQLVEVLKPKAFESYGKEFAEKLKSFIPVVYASARNFPIAYNWKIKFNETAKIPAFCNEFPELNHNEMAGFDESNVPGRFHFIFLSDHEDDSRIAKRMSTLESMYKERGFPVTTIKLEGRSILERIFYSVSLADLTTYFLAELLGRDPDGEPMIEDFKKRIG